MQDLALWGVAATDAALLVARSLFALLFVASALDKFRLDPSEVSMIRGLGLPAPERLEKLTGVGELVAAAALVLGIGVRPVAILLLLFVAFLTLTFLRWWSFEGSPEARQAMRSGFFGNWAIVGGLLLLAAIGPGRFALSPS